MSEYLFAIKQGHQQLWVYEVLKVKEISAPSSSEFYFIAVYLNIKKTQREILKGIHFDKLIYILILLRS